MKIFGNVYRKNFMLWQMANSSQARWKNIPYLFYFFWEYFFLKVYKIQSYGHTYNVRKINQKTKERLKWKLEQS